MLSWKCLGLGLGWFGLVNITYTMASAEIHQDLEGWRCTHGFKDAVIVHIHKRNDNHAYCNRYCGLIVSHSYSQLARYWIELSWTVCHTMFSSRTSYLREKMWIFPWSQHSWHDHSKADMGEIDLTKPFNIVHQEGLWKVLRKNGCMEKFSLSTWSTTFVKAWWLKHWTAESYEIH